MTLACGKQRGVPPLFTLMLTLVANCVWIGGAAAADAPCDGSSGTAFFGSAGLAAKFEVGDTHLGGTFTFIENNNKIIVREEDNGDVVGRFKNGPVNGDVASIEFDNPIHIVGILWHDNDPDVGETGWSLNGVPGPITASGEGVCTSEDIIADTVTIDAGGDSGGIDFFFEEVPVGICHNIGGPRDLGANCDMTGNCSYPTEEGDVLVTGNEYLGIIIGFNQDNPRAFRAHVNHGDGLIKEIFDPPLHLASTAGPHRASNVECKAERFDEQQQPPEPGN